MQNSRPTPAALCCAFSLLAPLTAQTWRADHELSAAQLRGTVELRLEQRMWPVSIAGRSTATGGRHQLVWSSTIPANPGPIYLDVDSTQYENAVLANAPLGQQPSLVDSTGEYPNERYTVAFARHSMQHFARHRMTSADYQTEFNRQAAAGLRASWVGASGTGANARLAAVWIRDGQGYAGVHDAPTASLRAALDNWRTGGLLPVSISAYGAAGAPLFAALSVVSSRAWTYSLEVDEHALCTELAARARAGERLLLLEGWDTPQGPRFVAVFAPESAGNVFRATGVDQPAFAPVDTAMQTFMQAEGISQASVAITRNGRLVLARGYTWAPPSLATTQPYSRFRIASVSKPLTSIGIMQLVEAGRIGIDQRVSTILDMRQWADPRAQNITIRHLLSHVGGFDRGRSGDPMFMDNAVSAALNRPLPTTPQMVIEYWSRRLLDFTPGAPDAAVVDSYSNFGFCMLGRVIETVSGLDYEEYMLRNVLERAGAGLARIGDALRCDQLPYEVDYDGYTLYPSVMGPGSPSTVELAYGAFNVRTMDAHGGWVCSALDLARVISKLDNRASSPLLAQASIDTMWSRPPHVSPSAAAFYGYGWAVRPFGSDCNAWHNGSLPGTYTMMARRTDGIDFVVLMNKRTANTGQIDPVLSNAIAQVSTWPTFDLFETTPAATSLGVGCAGSAGVPGLHLGAGSTPLAGEPIAIEMTRLPAGLAHMPLLLLGASATSYAGTPLPLDLTPYGAPCALRVSLDVQVFLANNAGTARLDLNLPRAPQLIGAPLYLQGLVTDSANALGVVFTGGLAVRIGTR